MGKWVCHCGNVMNDHYSPDENCYRVFTDIAYDELLYMADENGKVSVDAIFAAEKTYMYRCPKCKRLMIFEKDEFGNDYVSYCREYCERDFQSKIGSNKYQGEGDIYHG